MQSLSHGCHATWTASEKYSTKRCLNIPVMHEFSHTNDDCQIAPHGPRVKFSTHVQSFSISHNFTVIPYRLVSNDTVNKSLT